MPLEGKDEKKQNESVAKFNVELVTNNSLMHCVVKGKAEAILRDAPNGGVEIELKTDKLITQPGSSYLSPPSLGPLSLVATSMSPEDHSIDSKVNIKTPQFLSFFSPLRITNDVKITTPQPIGEVVREVLNPEKEPVTPSSEWKAKAIIKPPRIPLVPEVLHRDLTLTTPKPGDPLHRHQFHLKSDRDLFEGLPLPHTTLDATFTRVPPEPIQPMPLKKSIFGFYFPKDNKFDKPVFKASLLEPKFKPS